MLTIELLRKFGDLDYLPPPIHEFSDLGQPNAFAASILADFSGIRVVPKGFESGAEFDFFFGVNDETDEREVLLLRRLLHLDLFPIGGWFGDHAILLTSSGGDCYAVGIASPELYYVGPLCSSMGNLISGKGLIPVLPIRPYPQRCNFHVYEPGASGVIWIDCDEWIGSTIADESG